MSTSFRWLLVRWEGDDAEVPTSLRDVGLRSYGTFYGWFAAELSAPRGRSVGGSPASRTQRALEWTFKAFEEAVVVAADGRPALGITCVTSDLVYVIASAPDLPLAITVTNPDSAPDCQDGADALERCFAEYGEDGWWQTSIERLSDWTRHAPSPASATEIESILSGDYPFAEEAAARLLSALGLPTPPEAHPRFKEALYVRDHGSDSGPWGVTENAETAFLTGHGVDFHGVWAREGGPPIVRFPRTLEGEWDARYARLAMLFLPDAKYTDAIVVFDRRINKRGVVKPYPLFLRYVVGVGSNFVGIWHRRTGGVPLERFPRTVQGLSEAQRRQVELSLPFIRLLPSWRKRWGGTETS